MSKPSRGLQLFGAPWLLSSWEQGVPGPSLGAGAKSLQTSYKQQACKPAAVIHRSACGALFTRRLTSSVPAMASHEYHLDMREAWRESPSLCKGTQACPTPHPEPGARSHRPPQNRATAPGNTCPTCGGRKAKAQERTDGFFVSRKCPFDGTINERGLRALHGLGKQPTKGDTGPRTSSCFILRDCYIWPLPYIFSPFLLKVNLVQPTALFLLMRAPASQQATRNRGSPHTGAAGVQEICCPNF